MCHLYSASSEMLHFWSAQHGSYSFLHCKYTMPPLPCSSQEGATTEWTVMGLIWHQLMKLTTHLSTQWGWKAELALLADLQRTVYPFKWLPISCRSGADHWKFADQRPTFYHWVTHRESIRVHWRGQCFTAVQWIDLVELDRLLDVQLTLLRQLRRIVCKPSLDRLCSYCPFYSIRLHV